MARDRRIVLVSAVCLGACAAPLDDATIEELVATVPPNHERVVLLGPPRLFLSIRALCGQEFPAEVERPNMPAETTIIAFDNCQDDVVSATLSEPEGPPEALVFAWQRHRTFGNLDYIDEDGNRIVGTWDGYRYSFSALHVSGDADTSRRFSGEAAIEIPAMEVELTHSPGGFRAMAPERAPEDTPAVRGRVSLDADQLVVELGPAGSRFRARIDVRADEGTLDCGGTQ